MTRFHDDTRIEQILAVAARGEDVDPHADCADWIRKQACCCASRAEVKVVLPDPRGHVRTTDFLLCHRHFKASRSRLTDLSAIAFDVRGHLM